MYSENLKQVSLKFHVEDIPVYFGKYSDDFDAMELYEELFDYAYEIKNNLPLASNFRLLITTKKST